jgi:Type I phosphodiesterase / nucleotide pyrophosphatase
VPRSDRSLSPGLLIAAAIAAAFVFALLIALVGSLLVAVVVGLAVVGAGAVVAWRHRSPSTDLSRRRFLATMGAAGLGAVAGGAGIGRVVERVTRPDPRPDIDRMARDVGARAMETLRRGVYPGRSGDLQLVLSPFNTSNYSFESLKLGHRDPRSSHAMAWGYTERVPIVVYAPGLVEPLDSTEPVTLADLAPTTGLLIGHPFETSEAQVLPGITKPATRPKVVVTFVIDGGGWNVLTHWSSAWPHLKALMPKSAVYRNAGMGSFPSVTATAHATLGTGQFPIRHGINGHNMRIDGKVVKAWGEPGKADPTYLLVPTLAMDYADATSHRAWIGEIGYQIWHLGMIGNPGRGPGGRLPVAMYWDEDVTNRWQPQNPDLYRLPDGVPPRSHLTDLVYGYFTDPAEAKDVDQHPKRVCCSPPIIQYQGDIVAGAFEREPIGQGDATSLLYINYKSPDYTGHVYNMLAPEERTALEAVDQELDRIRTTLEQRFPGEFVLIVTADHGQCPLVDVAGGVRLDPIQLEEDIANRFGRSVWPVVQDVKPSEVYLDPRGLADAGVSVDEIAAWLAGYRYGDNIGPYVRPDAIDRGRQDHREFTGVFSVPYVQGLTAGSTARFGAGRHPDADPGIPSIA